MPDLDLIKQRNKGMRAFGKADAVVPRRVGEHCNLRGPFCCWYAAEAV